MPSSRTLCSLKTHFRANAPRTRANIRAALRPNHPLGGFVWARALYKLNGVWLEQGCGDGLKESINRENIP